MPELETSGSPASALSVLPFRYLWLNSITFYLVANALRFLYGWVVLDGLERSESVQGLAVFALGLPGIFLLLPAGVWADRMNRRKLLIGTQLATALVMMATAIFIGSGGLSLGLLIGSALVAGVTTAVGSPVRTSLLPEVLPPSLLFGGIALNAIAITGSLVLGAVTTQLVGEAFGFNGAFWYLAVLLVVGTLALLRMETPERTPTESDRATMRDAVGEGLRFVFKDKALRTLFLMLGLAGLVMNALMFVTLQAMVKEELGRDAGDAAPLLAMMGIGLAISSVFIMKRDIKNKGTAFLRAMLFGCTLLVLMGRATAYWQLIVLALVMGTAGGFFINMNQGLIQSNTPNELMGRVMGLYTLVQGGLTPIGALLLGLIATAIGPGNTMSLAAGLGLLLTLYVYLTSTELRTLQT